MSEPVTPDPSPSRTIEDETYRAGVIDLLSVIAYGELSGAFATVADAARAPRLDHKLALARMARGDFDHYEQLAGRLRDLGVEPEDSMEPFTAAIDEWHRRTPPADWYEGLMKAYAGAAIATDFYSEIARYVDPETRSLVERAVDSDEQDAFIMSVLSDAIAADPRVGSRLALWGRRLVGEALSQAQRVAATHDGLTALLVDDGSGVGADLAELTRMFERLTSNHTRRMEALGLTA
ncbi:hypothetical protein HX89_04475 [Dermacoccus nishinomiyaensis]|uniref:Ferritin-like domain-containing protein n=1 Tax=Dermacoccus nishinomiyaensis TaxID=1274 RepID=A0A075JJU7_9MICO|nr:ferritin-like fold-containing protein [Dermacoccus nishinomiyaensis]AIF40328.1 hypothetical protein HX89_04475 [Dermacoccus nishinomiyaensis]